MVLNRSNSTFAKTGEFFYTPEEVDVDLSDLTSPIPANARSLGYFNADGWTESDTVSTSADYAWQDNTMLNEFASEPTSTITAALAEVMKVDVLEFAYNTTVSPEGVYTVDPGAPAIRRTVWANITDGSRQWRVWLPSATARVNGDVTHSSTATTTIPVVITAFKRLIDGVEFGPKVITNPFLISQLTPGGSGE